MALAGPVRDRQDMRAIQALSMLAMLISASLLWTTAERGCSRDIPASAIEGLAQCMSVALPIPAEPLPGQRRAPCEDHQRQANGGCWRAFAMGDTPAEVAENCARSDFYEMEPGACLKRRIGYAPVPAPAPKPNSVK